MLMRKRTQLFSDEQLGRNRLLQSDNGTSYGDPFTGHVWWEGTMSQSTTSPKALIVGCGVAGPVLAMYLERLGITPVIYDGRPEPPDEDEFVLNVAANGTSVMQTLESESPVRFRNAKPP